MFYMYNALSIIKFISLLVEATEFFIVELWQEVTPKETLGFTTNVGVLWMMHSEAHLSFVPAIVRITFSHIHNRHQAHQQHVIINQVFQIEGNSLIPHGPIRVVVDEELDYWVNTPLVQMIRIR
jgi:hypothetical protein